MVFEMHQRSQPNANAPQQWFTVSEACVYVRMGSTKLRELIRDRKLTHSRLPSGSLLLSKDVLDAYVRSFEVPSVDIAIEVADLFAKKTKKTLGIRQVKRSSFQ